MLELKDVTISYKNVPTVEHFSMNMKQGQIISQGIETFQGQQDRDAACGQVLFQFRAASRHADAVVHRLHILLQGRDLPQSLPKPQLRQIPVVNENG